MVTSRLFIAMSALQGRAQRDAFDELSALGTHGIQLTPGNLVSEGFEQQVRTSGRPFRVHHGFAWRSYRMDVYDADGGAHVARDVSIHPPKTGGTNFDRWLEHARAAEQLIEVMYPGYHLGCGAQIEAAMRCGLRVAVDVSHLRIQERAGAIDRSTKRKLLDYDRIEEVHVSDNDGRADTHRAISEATPLLAWARERLRAGVPVVYESYLHRLGLDERHRQLDLLRDHA
jgi:hypothetical protein